MSSELILSIDQGTTNTKCLLVDRNGDVIFRMSASLELVYPQPGYVEQNPDEIWHTVRVTASACAEYAHASGFTIAGVSITNQRETALVWRHSTTNTGQSPAGRPLANAMSWQCRRSSEICVRLAQHARQIQDTSGLPLDPLITATKWAWFMERATSEQLPMDVLRVGTVDTWIIANLTGGAVHATDHTNASRTGLLNLQTLDWDAELIDLFGVSRSALAAILPSCGVFGVCSSIPQLSDVPIVSVIGDSHAALAGQGIYTAGTVKATYGTGSSLMMLTEALPKPVEHLARTIAWSTPDCVQYALEGNIAMTGSAVQWVGEFLALPNPISDAAALAETVPDAAGVVFVPAMVGLGAPYWDHEARGVIANLQRSHTGAHLARATLDSIAFQVADVFFEMESIGGIKLPALLADGGASSNDTLMQIQADLLNRPIHRAGNQELSAIGAAWLGGLAIGWWDSFYDLATLRKEITTFRPSLSGEEWRARRNAWLLAVRRVRLSEVLV